MQCACAALTFHEACPALTHIPTLSHRRDDFRERNVKSNIMFWFSLQVCMKNFSFLEKSSETWSKLCIGFHAKYSLLMSYFNEVWTFSTDIRKILECQISWKSVQREPSCSIRTDGRTERWTHLTKLIVAVRNFADGTKNGCRKLLQSLGAYTLIYTTAYRRSCSKVLVPIR